MNASSVNLRGHSPVIRPIAVQAPSGHYRLVKPLAFWPLALTVATAIAPPAHAAPDLAAGEMPVAADSSGFSRPVNSPRSSAIALNFEPPVTGTSPASPSIAPTEPGPTEPGPTEPNPTEASAAIATATNPNELYDGGSESVVARVVGAAEGTRTPDGGKTSLYEGHVDPGNGVWNRGTFSYQFGNAEDLSADEADRRQMAKIQRIHESVMLSKAEQHGVAPLTVAEELNGIDLINQAPLAVTEEGGYVERLAEAKQKKGLRDREAILDARVHAFWDESKGGWDAPGLRAYDDISKEASIRHDQQRRMGMIDQALEAYEQQHGAIAQSMASPSGASVPRRDRPEAVAPTPVPPATQPTHPNQVADLIIFNRAS